MMEINKEMEERKRKEKGKVEEYKKEAKGEDGRQRREEGRTESRTLEV